MMLLIPYEEHSQQKNGDREHGYRGRKLRTILRKISPEEKEGMCQSVLSPITGKLRFKGSPCKQVLVTISKRCFLDNQSLLQVLSLFKCAPQ